MNRILARLLGSRVCRAVLLLVAMGWAPATVADRDQVTQRETDNSETIVDIPDVALRRAVERKLGKVSGDPITRGEMASLYSLTATNVRQLEGIEHAANLWSLELGNRVRSYNRWQRRVDLPANAVSDVAPLSGLTSLRTLDLTANAVTDVTPLAGLTSLVSLGLGFNTISDVTPLAGLLSLTTLELRGNWISDISPLADLTSLIALELDHNTVSDASPLSGMLSLTRLDLANNAISDMSPLAALSSLSTLNLSRNAITDVSAIRGLTSLRYLGLSDNPISDVAPLSSLVSLRQLQLDRTKIDDVSSLVDMRDLFDLSLSRNDVSDISPLAGLASLRWVHLEAMQVSDLSPLAANDGLGDGDYVSVNGNPLDRDSRETHIPALVQRGVEVNFDEDLTGVDGVRDLSLRRAVRKALLENYNSVNPVYVLDVSNSGIEDLTGIEGAVGRLNTLFLDRNKTASIAPLSRLSLGVLTLADSMVEDWTPLANMASLYFLALDGNALGELPLLPSGLQYLYLANNRLSEITALADAAALVELDVSGNTITSLEPLAGQGQLRYLHVHDNQVRDISPLNLASLRELHMSNNAVGDVSPLLAGEELLMVDVRGNQLADDALAVLDALRERRVTVLAGETVPYFPAAGHDRQGFVRIVNRGDQAGRVTIAAVDDAGVRRGPVRLSLGARQAVHFNSADLEYGSAAKGLAGIGAPTAGDWRLAVISALDVEVLSYIRTDDGFVTAMHDVAADATVPFFNPGSNRNQRSTLRVVNTEAEPAKWTTGGYDDRGNWHSMTGSLLVRPEHALTLSAQALEDAHGLGDGSGKWRLRVRGFPWFAMSLLESPTGHLTNLSTAPAHTKVLGGTTLHRLPLFPAAGGVRQGFARLVNRSDASGEVTIWAVDDEGARSGPVRLTMGPRRVVHFNSADLEDGNPAKGLEGSVGSGEGDWRLQITSKLDLMALAYARTADGFLTSTHDLAPVADDGGHRVVFFNPGSNARQVSKLRLINDGGQRTRVTIDGIDDQGNGSGRVVCTVPAGSALTFTAAELEAGSERVAGGLGDGEGKWRLRVRSEKPISVMSLLETPTGHLTNVSTGTAD